MAQHLIRSLSLGLILTVGGISGLKVAWQDDSDVKKLISDLQVSDKSDKEIAQICTVAREKASGHGTDAQVKLAHSGILEVMANVMEKHLTDHDTMIECAEATDAIVVFNAEATEYLQTHTNAVEILMKGIKRFSKDNTAMKRLLPHIAGYTTSLSWKYGTRVKEAGGFDALFNALEDFQSDPFVQLAAWQGLSDHSHTMQGAEIIAEYGGHLAGVKRLLDDLDNAEAHQPNPHMLTLKYEILQNINGLLQNDKDSAYLNKFMSEGLPMRLMNAMHIEADRRPTQNVGAEVILNLVQRQPINNVPHEDFTKTLEAAMKTFAEPDLTPAWSGTITDSFPVLPAAQMALNAIKAAKSKANL